MDEILVYLGVAYFHITSIMLAERDKHANPMIVKKVLSSPAVSLYVTHKQAIELFHTKKIAAAIRGLWRKSISNV